MPISRQLTDTINTLKKLQNEAELLQNAIQEKYDAYINDPSMCVDSKSFNHYMHKIQLLLEANFERQHQIQAKMNTESDNMAFIQRQINALNMRHHRSSRDSVI